MARDSAGAESLSPSLLPSLPPSLPLTLSSSKAKESMKMVRVLQVCGAAVYFKRTWPAVCGSCLLFDPLQNRVFRPLEQAGTSFSSVSQAC